MNAAALPFLQAIAPVQKTDPGSAGTITVERNPCYVPIVTAGAETRTLARPTKEAWILTLYAKTIVTSCTITVTGGYNSDGDTTFVLSADDQWVTFISAYDGTNYLWRKLTDYGMGNIAPADSAVLETFSAVTATTTEINATADASANLVATTATQITCTALVHGNRTVVLNSTHTTTVTLPAASGTGDKYTFEVGVTGTDGSKIIQVANTTDIMQGASIAMNTQSTTIGFKATATDDTVTLNNTTTGGYLGTKVELHDIAAGTFLVRIYNITSGNPATPFSAGV